MIADYRRRVDCLRRVAGFLFLVDCFVSIDCLALSDSLALSDCLESNDSLAPSDSPAPTAQSVTRLPELPPTSHRPPSPTGSRTGSRTDPATDASFPGDLALTAARSRETCPLTSLSASVARLWSLVM